MIRRGFQDPSINKRDFKNLKKDKEGDS